MTPTLYHVGYCLLVLVSAACLYLSIRWRLLYKETKRELKWSRDEYREVFAKWKDAALRADLAENRLDLLRAELAEANADVDRVNEDYRKAVESWGIDR